MYCHACGNPVIQAMRFCARCGAQLLSPTATAATTRKTAPAPPVPLVVLIPAFPVLRTGGSVWRPLSGGGGLLAVLAFFLPWISVSCDTRGLSGRPTQLAQFSGYDLASGPRLQTPFGIQHLDASPVLWFVILAAVAVLPLSLA